MCSGTSFFYVKKWGPSDLWKNCVTACLLPLISKSNLEGDSQHFSEESTALSAPVSSAFQLLTLLPRALGCRPVSQHSSSGKAERLMSAWISSMWWQEAGPKDIWLPSGLAQSQVCRVTPHHHDTPSGWPRDICVPSREDLAAGE